MGISGLEIQRCSDDARHDIRRGGGFGRNYSGGGYVDFTGAIVIGVMASILCFIAVGYIKHIFHYDDSLDAFGVHGISGIWGTLATGLFATKAVNPAVPTVCFTAIRISFGCSLLPPA